jgi:hypothetical protein
MTFPHKSHIKIHYYRQITLFLFLQSAILFSQVIDTFSDGDFIDSPAWGGNTSDWAITTSSNCGAGASNSYTLQLDVAAGSGTKYLSSQQTSSWGTSQSWGFWIGRRSSSSATSSNTSYVWLFANESDLTASTVDGYRIRYGDNSGDDEIVLERIDDGSATAVITSSGAVGNGIADIGFCVRVTRNSSSSWTLYTSTLPTANGEGDVASATPSSSNAATSQGTATDNTYTSFSNGYFGFEAKHSSGSSPRSGAEFDQYYFDTSSDASLPVELLKWYGRATNTYIQLNWETASEIDNLGFLIYKGVVGNPLTLWQDYRSNPSLNGQGSTSFHTKYSLLDRSVFPDQTYVYLLSDVDIHGIETRHDTIEVKLNRKKQFTVYSNPTNPEVQMVLNLHADSHIQIDIYNILGHLVESIFQGETQSGEHSISWDGSKFSSGYYLVTLRINDHLASSQGITILK